MTTHRQSPWKWLTVLILILFVVACGGTEQANSNGNGRSGEAVAATETSISVSGAFALFPLMTIWTEAYQALHANVQFDVQAGGAGKGMTDVLSGAADVAMLSREPRQEELDQGAFLVPVTIDSVLGTVNAGNPHLEQLLQQGITPEDANRLWVTQEIRTWGELLGNGNSQPINVYTRSDSSGAAEMWALFSEGQAQEDLRGTAVNGDPGVAEAVRQDQAGIGYNNVAFAYDPTTGQPITGLHPIPLDLNGNGQIDAEEDFYGSRDEFTAAVSAGRYPFPPARVLYLVTKGEPDPAISAFYRWVLTDGQRYVPDAGYVSLTGDRIQATLDLLGE